MSGKANVAADVMMPGKDRRGLGDESQVELSWWSLFSSMRSFV